MKIKLNEIKVGERIRKEIGDLEDLQSSMRDLGLMQPIIVDEQNNLIAGYRRYLCAQRQGWDEIEAVKVCPNNKYEKFVMELQENTLHKPLSWVEEVKAMEKEKQLYEETFPEATPKAVAIAACHHKRIPGLKTYVQAKSKLVSRSAKTVITKLTLAKLIKKYPELENEPTMQRALRKYEELTGKRYGTISDALLHRISIYCSKCSRKMQKSKWVYNKEQNVHTANYNCTECTNNIKCIVKGAK